MRPSEAPSAGASGPKGTAGAAAGAAAAIVALGVGEAVRSLRAAWEHPVVSVASWIVDRAPAWLKTFAIRAERRPRALRRRPGPTGAGHPRSRRQRHRRRDLPFPGSFARRGR